MTGTHRPTTRCSSAAYQGNTVEAIKAERKRLRELKRKERS